MLYFCSRQIVREMNMLQICSRWDDFALILQQINYGEVKHDVDLLREKEEI